MCLESKNKKGSLPFPYISFFPQPPLIINTNCRLVQHENCSIFTSIQSYLSQPDINRGLIGGIGLRNIFPYLLFYSCMTFCVFLTSRNGHSCYGWQNLLVNSLMIQYLAGINIMQNNIKNINLQRKKVPKTHLSVFRPFDHWINQPWV